MPTATVPKRRRRRKRKPKQSSTFGSATSGPSELPSSTEAIFARLVALFAMPQKANKGTRKRATGGGGGSRQVAAFQLRSRADAFPTAHTLQNEKRKTKRTSSSKDHFKGKNCQASSSKSTSDKAAFIGEDVIACNKPEPTLLTQSDVEDITSKLREFLRDNGPSQEDDLLEVLSISQAQIIIDLYGTITAFLDRLPGFEVVYEELYTFVYCEYADSEGDVLDEGTFMSISPCSNEDGCQHSLAVGDGRRRTGATYSATASDASAGDEGADKQEKFRMKHNWSQAVWLPPYHSRALPAVQQSCEGEVLTAQSYIARFTEMKSTLQKREKQIVQLKERISTIQETQAREMQILRDEIEQLKAAAAPPPRKVPDARKSVQQPFCRNEAWPRSQFPRSRLRRLQRTPPNRARVKETPRLLPCETPAPLGPLMRRQTQAPRSKAEKSRVLAFEPKIGPFFSVGKVEVKPYTLPCEQADLLVPTMRGGAPPTLSKAKDEQLSPTVAPKPRRLSPMRLRAPLPRRKTRKNSCGFLFEHTAELALPMSGPQVEQIRRARHLGRKAVVSSRRRRVPSPQRNIEGSSRVLPVRETALLTQGMRRSGPSPRLKAEDPRAQPRGPNARLRSLWRRTPSGQRTVKGKPRSLLFGETTLPVAPSVRETSLPRPKAKKMPQGRTPGSNARRRSPALHRTPSPRQNREEKPRVFPHDQAGRLVTPIRRETSPRCKAEKVRAVSQQLRVSTARPAPLIRRTSRRSKAEVKPGLSSNGPIKEGNSLSTDFRPPNPVDERSRGPAEQPQIRVCGDLQRAHQKHARFDVASKSSSGVVSPAKSKAEEHMKKLVQMVKNKKPEYTEQEIRMRLDALRRSHGGFSHMTLNDIVALMVGELEERER